MFPTCVLLPGFKGPARGKFDYWEIWTGPLWYGLGWKLSLAAESECIVTPVQGRVRILRGYAGQSKILTRHISK
jgi:hypothetical protein